MKSTAIYPNRVKDKERIEKIYGLEEFGDSSIEFKTPGGLLLAKGYKRVVYGDHGPYIEFLRNQIIFENWIQVRPSEYPYYYGILYPKDSSQIKLYDQVRSVKHLPNPPKGKYSYRGNREEGYADYKPGFLYISPDEIAEPIEKENDLIWLKL